MRTLVVEGRDEVADSEEKSGDEIRSTAAMELQRSSDNESDRTR